MDFALTKICLRSEVTITSKMKAVSFPAQTFGDLTVGIPRTDESRTTSFGFNLVFCNFAEG